MIQKITQSFIKDMREYLNADLCGNLIREKWVNDRLLDNSDEPGAMELGCYFEFLLTGALPKNGKVPLPIYMSSEVKKNGGSTVGLGVAQMYDEYRKVHKNVDIIKNYLNAMGLKISRAGVKLTKGRFEGTIDVIAEVVKIVDGFTWKLGDSIALDLKYSGLVGEAGAVWKNKHGWQWSPIQKEYHGTQAKHYHLVSGLPFYFFVTQSNNDKDKEPIVKLFHVPVDEFMVEQHIVEANYLYDKLEFYAGVGFEPRPEFTKCQKCPLHFECKDKHTYPHPELVDLNTLE